MIIKLIQQQNVGDDQIYYTVAEHDNAAKILLSHINSDSFVVSLWRLQEVTALALAHGWKIEIKK